MMIKIHYLPLIAPSGDVPDIDIMVYDFLKDRFKGMDISFDAHGYIRLYPNTLDGSNFITVNITADFEATLQYRDTRFLRHVDLHDPNSFDRIVDFIERCKWWGTY